MRRTMPSKKPLPEIAPCPCGVSGCYCTLTRSHAFKRVFSECGWRGPQARTDREAIELWNRRSDEAANSLARWLNAKDWFLYPELFMQTLDAIKSGEFRNANDVLANRDKRTPKRMTRAESDEAAERRGAVSSADWLWSKGLITESLGLNQAIERGEVVGKQKGTKRP